MPEYTLVEGRVAEMTIKCFDWFMLGVLLYYNTVSCGVTELPKEGDVGTMRGLLSL
jgi:hypothetical protein